MPDKQEPQDATAVLAELLRNDVETLAQELGGPWFELAKDDTEGVRFVNGVPAQVLIRLDPERVTVAQPKLIWQGRIPAFVLGKTHLDAPWDTNPSLADLAAAAASASTARRRTFRWCRYCRELHDPGNLHERDVCMGCAEQFLGVVH